MASWMKAVLISTGFLATAMHLKVIVPVAVDFSQAPILFSSLLAWLKPPYLYVITNVIIVVIFVSSKFFRSTVSSTERKDYEVSYSGDNKFQTHQNDHQQNVNRAPLRRRTESKDSDFGGFIAKVSALIVVKEPEVVHEEKERLVVEAAEMVIKEEKSNSLVVVAKSGNQTPVEKPLVTARIGQRKPVVKTTPAERNSMRALRVAKPKRNETLENTWKMIMEGKAALPLTSYYKRPDTFGLGEETTKQSDVLKKSEAFTDMTNYYQSLPAILPPPPPPLVKIKKVKVSRSRDELNRRVEAFIKKCNDERFASMRLDKEVARSGLSY